MAGGLVRLLSKISLLVGGSDLSASNPVWAAFGTDATQSGSITGNGQTVAIACDGKPTVTIGISGTYSATLQFEALQDGNWEPVRAYFAPAAGGGPSLAYTITGLTGVASIASGGCSQVRIRATAYTSGTATIVERASTADRVVLAMLTAMGIIGSAVPDSAVQIGVKDGSGFLQSLVLGVQAIASSLSVTPATSSVWDISDRAARVLGVVTGAAGAALALEGGNLATILARTPALGQAAVTSSSPVVQAPWLLVKTANIATSGWQIKASAGALASVVAKNATGATATAMVFDGAPVGGAQPAYISSATTPSGAYITLSAPSAGGGLTISTSLYFAWSSTADTFTAPATSTASFGWAAYA